MLSLYSSYFQIANLQSSKVTGLVSEAKYLSAPLVSWTPSDDEFIGSGFFSKLSSHVGKAASKSYKFLKDKDNRQKVKDVIRKVAKATGNKKLDGMVDSY